MAGHDQGRQDAVGLDQHDRLYGAGGGAGEGAGLEKGVQLEPRRGGARARHPHPALAYCGFPAVPLPCRHVAGRGRRRLVGAAGGVAEGGEVPGQLGVVGGTQDRRGEGRGPPALRPDQEVAGPGATVRVAQCDGRQVSTVERGQGP